LQHVEKQRDGGSRDGDAGSAATAPPASRGSDERSLQTRRGGTAVATSINTLPGFGEKIASEIAKLTGHPFVSAPNKFAAQGSLDALVAASSSLRAPAVSLMKIPNDMRWLGSEPGAGLHELNLPAKEPGSSIMPGKVNPTQKEARVCIEVIGEDNAVAFAGSQGNFELSAMRPIIAIIVNNVLRCARILADASEKLRTYSIEGIEAGQRQDKAVRGRVADARDRPKPGHRLRRGLGHSPQGAGRGHDAARGSARLRSRAG
jgi:fumarate hydratase class II